MRVGWLVDERQTAGGAELTQAELRDAAPDGVEIVPCTPGRVHRNCDRYVIHNCVSYSIQDLRRIQGKPVVKMWHDVGPWISPEVRAWIDANAIQVCCSPLQAEYMGLDVTCIPPPVDLQLFEAAAMHVNGSRAGNVCVGSWANYGKAAHKVAEWSAANGPVAFYGSGPFAPQGSREVPYDDMPGLLASFQRFVFLPMVLEPFGRVVAEAWAAGCEIVTNELVGAKYWLQERPEAIGTAGEDFWKLVTA